MTINEEASAARRIYVREGGWRNFWRSFVLTYKAIRATGKA